MFLSNNIQFYYDVKYIIKKLKNFYKIVKNIKQF